MSSKSKSPYGQIIIGLLVGGLGLAWALHGVPMSELGHELKNTNMSWLLMVAAMFMLQQVIRAIRQMLIIQAKFPEHQFRQSFAILCIGFFFINTLPARLGEFVRPMLLKRDGIPYGTGLALIFTERTIDLCAALVMFTATFGQLKGEALNEPIIQSSQNLVVFLLPVLIMTLIGFVFIAPRFRQNIEGLGRFALMRKIIPFVLDFVNAMAYLKPKRMALIVLLTILTWTLTGWMTLAGLAAFDLHHGRTFLDGIGILAFTMLGMAAPSAPGFAGAYEAAVIFGCICLGMNETVRITAFAIAFHWWIHLVQSISALAYATHSHYGFGVVINQLRQKSFQSNTHKPAAPSD